MGQPLAGEAHEGPHVGGVHVGPFLPVHLHRDEVGVEEAGHLLVLEALPVHHVAPVAAGVAHGEEDGLVLGLGLAEGLLAEGYQSTGSSAWARR